MADKKKDKKGGWSEDAQMGGNPFAALAGLAPALPVASEEPAAPGAAPAAPGAAPAADKAPKEALVRVERKGRGGKTVTLVERLGLDAAGLESWCKQLKGKLGAGGAVEGEALVIQGDQRDRVEEALRQLGVGKVRRG
jgi:translation initiation factor 1